VLSEPGPTKGSGTTRNLSSSGVAFEVPEILPPGSFVELAIQWPVPLNGSVALRLVVQGSVTWNRSGIAAIRISRSQFRTQRKVEKIR
jgi:PilZ domain